MSKRDLKLILVRAESQGWSVALTRRNHYKLVSPTGEVVYCPSTPSEYRGIKNLLAELKKRGYKENTR